MVKTISISPVRNLRRTSVKHNVGRKMKVNQRFCNTEITFLPQFDIRGTYSILGDQ